MQNLWYLFGAKAYTTWTLRSHRHKICMNEKRRNFIKINTLDGDYYDELVGLVVVVLVILNHYHL
jgi:hypothetical protein